MTSENLDKLSEADEIHSRRAVDTDREIGLNIRRLRRAAGLSQAELANSLGLSYQQVQKYETGANRISVSRLMQIADALKVDVGTFLNCDVLLEEAPHFGPHFTEITRLLEAFCGIGKKDSRTRVVALAELLAGIEG